jgi:zinc finger protein 830
MADVRTLLQREREARRIQHPHLSYSKSGALTCIVCNLNVKSEALWEGHLKSANHRKNLRDAATNINGAGNGKKRKIEKVIEDENPRKRKPAEDEEAEGEGRKKRQVSFQIDITSVEDRNDVEQTEPNFLPGFVKSEATAPQPTPTPTPSPPTAPAKAATIDEDEWAAFEAEVAPLARLQAQDYVDATITAAPVSADELAAQQAAASSRRTTREQEADDEREESEQRLADEFDVMEEMEERIRRLKEKREALRVNVHVNPTPASAEAIVAAEEEKKPPESDSESESDDEDGDDWFS